MVSSIFPVQKTRPYKPKLFMPRSRKPEKFLAELLNEARRLISEIEKIRSRHLEELSSSEYESKLDENNLNLMTIKKMLYYGEPEFFSYEFHEMRRSLIFNTEHKIDFNMFDYFIKIGSICGYTPLLKSIWDVTACINLIYTKPALPTEDPKFDVLSFNNYQLSINVIAYYVDTAGRFGDEILIAILNGAKIDVQY